jgi:hypothetical protein
VLDIATLALRQTHLPRRIDYSPSSAKEGINPMISRVLPTVIGAVFLGSVAPTIAQTPQPRGATTFFCGQSDDHPATLVKVGDRTLQSPLIVWTSTAFGDDYTPQRRCEIVSARMANAVAENNGRLQNLRLAIGELNSQTILCYTNGTGSCSLHSSLKTLAIPRRCSLVC